MMNTEGILAGYHKLIDEMDHGFFDERDMRLVLTSIPGLVNEVIYLREQRNRKEDKIQKALDQHEYQYHEDELTFAEELDHNTQELAQVIAENWPDIVTRIQKEAASRLDKAELLRVMHEGEGYVRGEDGELILE